MAAGFSRDEAEALFESGYVIFPNFDDIVIDRFYGGALTSVDYRTRFPTSELRKALAETPERPSARVFHATSWADVQRIIDKDFRTQRTLSFRGQILNYPHRRAIPNPHFAAAGLGEISLVPSLWRSMLGRMKTSFCDWFPPAAIEWSLVLDKAFDVEDIERRLKRLRDAGNWVHTISEMEDCGDPLVEDYARVRGDLFLEYGLVRGITDGLNTLLQHYGMLSPMLDLTTDLEIARFFATNHLVKSPSGPRYEFVGTNGKQSVIYIFALDQNESYSYEHARAWKRFAPQRPERQQCVVVSTNSFSLNLPGYFLVGLITLDFDDILPGTATAEQLFPNSAADKFLKALLDVDLFADFVTTF